jgi:hypothetical protein
VADLNVPAGDNAPSKRPAGSPSTEEHRSAIDVQRPQLEFESFILRHVSDAVISIDNDDRVTYLNASAERRGRSSAVALHLTAQG